MHKLNNFSDFGLCSILRDIFSVQKFTEIKRCFFKHKIKICVSLLLLVVILIIIYFLKSINSSKIHKIVTKRSVNDLIGDENIFKTSKMDIELIPENRGILNHSYIEKEFEKNSETSLRRLNTREGWSSEAFESKIKHFGLTREILTKGVQKPEEQSKLTDLGSSMCLKGYYIKSEHFPENQLDGKYLYSKEINNLMLNNLNEGKERKKLPPRSLKFKSQGSPFQLPTKGQDSLGQESFHVHQIFKKHPMTLYLEFYPMRDSQDLNKKFNPNSNIFKQPQNKFHTSDIRYSFNVEKIISPQENRNRMIMKLNLYPKELNFPKHHFSKQRRISRSKYSSNLEKKSLGWFYKQKKNNPKNCFFMGIHPREKRISVKWKNERGERILAHHVAVKTQKPTKLKKNLEKNK